MEQPLLRDVMLLLRRLLCALVLVGILGGAVSSVSADSWQHTQNGEVSMVSDPGCASTDGVSSVACDSDCDRPSSSDAMDCGPCEGTHACVAVLAGTPLVGAGETSRAGTAGIPRQAAGRLLSPPFGPPRAFS